MRGRQAPALRIGERVRLTPGGPVLTVMRTSPCAAYVGRVVTSSFDTFDKVTRAPKRVTIERTVTEAISLHAFVERVTEEDTSGQE